MYRLEYKITTKAPIVISSHSETSNLISTRKYINGSTINGLFAWRYIKTQLPLDHQQKAHEHPFFKSAFLDGEITFTNLYPRPAKYKEYSFFHSPLSLFTRKDNENEAIDLLQSPSAMEEQVIPLNGFIHINNNNKRIIKYSPQIIENLHISKKEVNSSDQIFYYSAIGSSEVFYGEVIGSEKNLLEFHKIFGNSLTGRIGKSKSAQYGKVLIEFISNKPEKIKPNIDLDDIEFNLSFTSPVIVTNKFGYSEPLIENLIQKLEEEFQLKIEQPVQIYSKTERVETFNSKWRMTNPSTVAFSSGTTINFRCGELSEVSKSKIIESSVTGIGNAIHLGFGRFKFNLSQKETYTVENDLSYSPKMPSIPIPELTRSIVKKSINSQLIQVVTNQAIQDANNFERKPSNSLIGKLELALEKYSANEFIDLLKVENQVGLRKPARKQLQKSISQSYGMNLLNFITSNNPSFPISNNRIQNDYQSIINKISNDLKKRLNLTVSIDNDKIESIKQQYLMVFLRSIRKGEKN